MRYGNLTYHEINKCADEGWIVILPTGCMEQQGPHLPVDTDTWFVEQICIAGSEIAEKKFSKQSLVLPALPYGPTPEHKGFGSGYIDLPQEIHTAVIRSVLKSLIEQRFRRIILWKGCGQHKLDQVVANFNMDHKGVSKVLYPELPYQKIWNQVGHPSDAGGHAGTFITSIAMYMRSNHVRKGLISDPKNKPVDWGEPDLDFSHYTSTGVIGDPTNSTYELGAELWKSVVDSIALSIKDFAEVKI